MKSSVLRLLALLLVVFVTQLAGLGVAGAQERTVTLQVTQVSPAEQSSCDDWDFYMYLHVNGVRSGKKNLPDFWDHTPCVGFSYGPEATDISFAQTTLACESPIIDFRIELWERDDGIFSDDDDHEADHSFTVDITDPSQLSGCHNEGSNGGFCWTINVEVPLPSDLDGDGLSDDEEVHGVDVDCDGVMTRGVDLFLPEMGVNPNHKDLLVEVNWFEGWEPTVGELQRVKDAFANAPIDAGGLENPDGTIGVNLVIDAGNLMNDVGAPNTIGGRVLGPSNESPSSSVEFHALMDEIEAANRVGYFRQVVVGPTLEGDMDSGVAGRAVGNDRVQTRAANAETLMHELGHTLGLLHGGETKETTLATHPSGHNCKPTQLSIMNYRYAGGIPFETGGSRFTFIDYAPSKIPDDMIVVSAAAMAACPAGSFGCNRRLPAVLPMVHESALDESIILAPDSLEQGILIRHLLEFTDPMTTRIEMPLSDVIDWDNDGMLQPTEIPVSVNIDVIPDFDSSEGCNVDVNGALEFIPVVDEWSNIKLPPGRGVFGSLEDPNAYSTDDHEPFDEDFVDAARERATTTDLRILGGLDPLPVRIGSPVTFTASVQNLGNNSAFGATLQVLFPVGVTVVESPEGCEEVLPSWFVCSVVESSDLELRALSAGGTIDYEFTFVADANTTGATRNILAYVSHDGPDPDLVNNTLAVNVSVLPEFLSFDDPTRPWVGSYTGGGTLMPTTSGNVTTPDLAGVLNCGYHDFESPTFDTAELEVVGDQLVLDVWVPSAQTQSWGDLQLKVNIPSANLWDVWIGQRSISGLLKNQWVQVSFALPSGIVETLLGDYPDARFRITSNVPICGSPVLIDSIRFGGTIMPRSLFHVEGSAGIDVTSSSVLTFDSVGDWSSTQTVVGSESSLVTQGTGAISFTPGSWARIESRVFATTELVGVTNMLSFDVHIPDLPPDYYWLGQMNVFIDCPSAGLWNAYVGYQPLQILFDDEFNHLEYMLPDHVVDVLSGNFNDCRIALELSTNPAFGPFVIDNGGFTD